MQLIGKIVLGALLLIFGFLTLGMGICATAYTADTNGVSLLFGLPLTALLGFIAYLVWCALREANGATDVAAKKDDPAP